MNGRFTHRVVDFLTSLLLIFLLISVASSARADSDEGIVRVKSAVPMSEAITRIKADIAAKGIKFFSEIDQSKLAADAGINRIARSRRHLPEPRLHAEESSDRRRPRPARNRARRHSSYLR